MYDATEGPIASDTGPEFHERMAVIGRAVSEWDSRLPEPRIDYTARERAVWTATCRRLYATHAHHACEDYLVGWETLGLTSAQVPTLSDINQQLLTASGFRLVPSVGQPGDAAFYHQLADGLLPAALHLRHREVNTERAEPDLIHAIVGHAPMLATQRFALLYRLVGDTGVRLETKKARTTLRRLFWFVCEVGVVEEQGRTVASGAQILSAPQFIETLPSVTWRPLDMAAMCRGDGDGLVLYRARSADELTETFCALLAVFDDDTPERFGV